MTQQFQVTLIPCSQSPLIRDMHRTTKQFAAGSLREAKALVAQAFPDGFDMTGSWAVEKISPAPQSKE